MVSLEPREALDKQLPVREHMRLQASHWRFERVGFLVLLLVVALSLLGLFSNGPLSEASYRSPTGALQVQHQRFLRNSATTTLKLHVRSRPGQVVEVLISGGLLAGGRLTGLSPEPQSSAAHDGKGIALNFKADASGRAHILVDFTSDGIGPYRFTIAANGEVLKLRHFIYP